MMNAGRPVPRHLDFQAHNAKYDPTVHTRSEVIRAAKAMFADVASDLGVSDYRDDAFQDYAGDTMASAGVPDALITDVLTHLSYGV